MKKFFAVATLALSLAGFSLQARADTAVGMADTNQLVNGPAISALFSNNNDWIQAYATITDTSGGFHFGLGGMYKFTVAGTNRLGFHVGPGISLGNAANDYGTNKFFFTVEGVVGAHATIFDRVILAVDGGPVLTVTDHATGFKMRPFGTILGASVHYLF